MKILLITLIAILVSQVTFSQIKINEASNRNNNQIADANSDYPDWIEIYNAGTEDVNLANYSLSDDRNQLKKWSFTKMMFSPKKWQLVFASGKDIPGDGINHWETAVRDDDMWRWINPDATTPANWMQPGFDDTGWAQGKGGFGFGDGDDSTRFDSTFISVYTRIRFTVTDTSSIMAALLHVDFDDGFVAYLNGTEIARATVKEPIAWNSRGSISREALLFRGQKPLEYPIKLNKIKELLTMGENILAVECHNVSPTSNDMSLRVFLSFGLFDGQSQFGPTPDWFSVVKNHYIHTNFKISGKGETIYLSNPGGQIIDSLVLPPNMPINYSLGSITDGSSERGYFINATPDASNNSQTAYTNGYEPMPVTTISGGYYYDTIDVALTKSSTTSQIRYTTDGQTPKSNSTLYTGPIRISSTQVIKARCFSTTNKMPSPILTNTYILGQEPTPAGILSITMEETDLYGSTGIYDNWQEDWKRPCYIEYFDPEDHNLVFKQNAGIKIDGGAGGSRSNPQHSFRVEPGNGSFGDGDLKYQLIPSRPNRKSYESFYLRNGSNQYMIYPCKDAIETRCMGKDTYNTYSGYTPVNVYLNGQYWGYYELREKIDADYFKQYFGTKTDSLELLSLSYWYNSVLRGVEGIDPVTQFNNDYEQFLKINTDDTTFWDQANQLFDMTYYTDYICAQTWIGDTDWPFNNIKIHRSPETNHTWRFSLVDLEWSLNPNGWSTSSDDHIRYMLNQSPGIPYIRIWLNGMNNKRFQDYFINRLADLMNTAWLPDRLKFIADSIYGVTRPELPGTVERWGDGSVTIDDYMIWFDYAHSIMVDELTNRTGYVRNHVLANFNLPKTETVTLDVGSAETGGVQISTVTPETYPWSGVYFDGIPVKIVARPKHGYIFHHWDANPLLTDLQNPVFYGNLSQSTTFVAHFVEDTSSGLVTISEINYNSEPSIDAGDWVEFWNYSRTVPTDISGWYFTDDNPDHKFTFPDNTVLKPNERVVVVQDFMSFRSQFPGVKYLTDLTFSFGNKSDAVKLYDNFKKLIAEVNYADSAPWPLGADGQGRTMELKDPYNPTNNPQNWFEGCIGGSPGNAFSYCDEPIVFSEINYNSDSLFNPGNWVELLNVGASAADLSEWKFKDEVDSLSHTFLLPQGTVLESNQNLVLAQNVMAFATYFPDVKNYIGPFVFKLSNKGELIRLYDNTGRLKQSVKYNDKQPWPELADGNGYTLELNNTKGIMNDGNNWFAGCYGGSPGIHYTTPCTPVGIQKQDSAMPVTAYPNPFTNQLTIEMGKTIEVTIRMYNYTGQLVYTGKSSQNQTIIDLSMLPTGFYLLNLVDKNGIQQTIRVVKR